MQLTLSPNLLARTKCKVNFKKNGQKERINFKFLDKIQGCFLKIWTKRKVE
jgi:hypothetical protein